jgi:hypothetical protein
MPEDALWTLIRLDPGQLPTGSFELLRGPLNARFAHRPVERVRARGALAVQGDDDAPGGAGTLRYTVSFPDSGRELAWVFQPEFPWRIEYFSEKIPGRPLTEAVREKTTYAWYWNENQPRHENKRREALNLPY